MRHVQRMCWNCRYPLKGLEWWDAERAEPGATPQVCCPECGTWQEAVALRPLPSLKQSFMWCSAVPIAATAAMLLGYAFHEWIGVLLLAGALVAALISPLAALAVFEERFRLHPYRRRLLLALLLGGWAANFPVLFLAHFLWFRLIN